MMRTDTLAQLGYRAQRIEPKREPCQLTKMELDQLAEECTTFLDRCAWEAAVQGWFGNRTRGSILAALAERPATAKALVAVCDCSLSMVNKTLKMLREERVIVVVGRTTTKGAALIYALADT